MNDHSKGKEIIGEDRLMQEKIPWEGEFTREQPLGTDLTSNGQEHGTKNLIFEAVTK